MQDKILFSILVILFGILYYSNIDLLVSNNFYLAGQSFYLRHNLWVRAIKAITLFICIIFIVGAVISTIRIFITHKSINLKHYTSIIYVSLVCLLGPGVIIHYGFKDHFCRPRPINIIEYEGHQSYVKPFIYNAGNNCSFPSGHAAVGFMILAVAWLYKGWKKNLLTLVSFILGFGIGLIRIIEGDHFLSDVVFSAIVVYATCFILRPISVVKL